MNILNIATGTTSSHGSEEQVTISALAEHTGFPAEFIKEELLLNEDAIDISMLREKMLNYLQSAMA